MLLIDFFESKYKPQRLLGKSQNTTRLYRISIRQFSNTIGRPARIEDLNDENVLLHMQTLLDRGRSPATANKERNQLLTIWRYATQKKLLDTWPDVPELKEPERTPVAWLPHEFEKLLLAISHETGHFEGVPRSLWWETMVLTCLDSGERIGAVRAMKWKWFAGDWVVFPAEARKGNRRDRAYRLGKRTMVNFRAIKTMSPKEPFPFPFSQNYIWILFGKILKRAGLPNGSRDKFHKIRRTTGSVAYSCGLDPQDVLDHQYRKTTKRYLDPRYSKDDQACDVVCSFVSDPSGFSATHRIE